VAGGAINDAGGNEDDVNGSAEVPTRFDQAASTYGDRGTGMGDADKDSVLLC
jgi:hypothetical protein